jgi:cell wall-associated NlpC family hydrolase
VLSLGGGSHAHGASARRTAGHSASITRDGSARQSPATGASPATSSSGARRVNVAETADPEEASSFPAPASVRHKSASTPSKAGEQVVAAGAPSDAEVKQELAQMQSVERSAKRAQQDRLKPVPGGESVGGNGTIPIPPNVPEAVQRVIAGANAIADFPYVFGGGHASFVDNAYDCSGSVSYALAAGGLLSAPETSGELESWGAPGPGRYITIEAAAGHVYMYVDGVMYNTAGRSGVYASRWQVKPVDNSGFVTRHWPGL